MIKRTKDKLDVLAKNYSLKVGLDLHYIFKSGFWIYFGQIFNMLKFFVLTIVFANFLSKEIYGQYTFVLSILYVGSIFSLPGMGAAIVKSVASGFDKTYYVACKEIFKWSWFGTLFIAIVSYYYYFIGNFDLALVLIVVSLASPFYSVSAHYTSFFNGKKLFNIAAILNIIMTVFNTLLIILIVFFSDSLFFLAIGTVFSQIIFQSYFSMFVVKKYVSNNRKSKKDISFGKKLSFVNVISSLFKKYDSLITAALLGFQDVAVYAIALTIPTTIFNFVNSSAIIALPKLVKNDVKFKHIVLVSIPLFFVVIISMLLSYFLIPIFYPAYVEARFYSVIISFIILTFPLSVLTNNFFAKGRFNDVKYNVFLHASIYVVLSVFLGLNFGIIGIISAKLVSLFIKYLHALFLTFIKPSSV